MHIHPEALVADVAAGAPATIKIFQQHGIEFCCGGRIPLSEASARHGLDLAGLIAELTLATGGAADQVDWRTRPLSEIVAHIQRRFHNPLREELPRLEAMMQRVVTRHGDRLPDTLLPLSRTFETLRHELLDHMAKEDAVLFPAIESLERQEAGAVPGQWTWIAQPIGVMEAEHEAAGAALARMRELTGGYQPPDGACPTFRGLYYGLSELEREMHEHVHLENHVLFPRADQLASERGTPIAG